MEAGSSPPPQANNVNNNVDIEIDRVRKPKPLRVE
jgi:hypothetical protein